jgi:hypothetical protein
MRDQTKKKKEKKEIKFPDLKVAKDPKGGVPPPCGPGHGTTIPAVQTPRQPEFIRLKSRTLVDPGAGAVFYVHTLLPTFKTLPLPSL